MQRRGAEGAMPHSLRQQGLDRDENLESTAVRRRGNRQGGVTSAGNLSGYQYRGVTLTCCALFFIL